MVHAIISSRVDYCNSLLCGASSHIIRKMQTVINSAALLVYSVGRFDHVTPVMRDKLHWLPVQESHFCASCFMVSNSEVRQLCKLEYRCRAAKIVKLSYFVKIRLLPLLSHSAANLFTLLSCFNCGKCSIIDRLYIRPISSRQKSDTSVLNLNAKYFNTKLLHNT